MLLMQLRTLSPHIYLPLTFSLSLSLSFRSVFQGSKKQGSKLISRLSPCIISSRFALLEAIFCLGRNRSNSLTAQCQRRPVFHFSKCCQFVPFFFPCPWRSSITRFSAPHVTACSVPHANDHCYIGTTTYGSYSGLAEIIDGGCKIKCGPNSKLPVCETLLPK